MELSAVLTPAIEGGYVALNPETGTITQGENIEEAIASLLKQGGISVEDFIDALRA